MWSPPKIFAYAVLAFTTLVYQPADLWAQIRLPAIDPSGNRLFLPAPNSTTLVGPLQSAPHSGSSLFQHHRGRTNNATNFPKNHSSIWGHHNTLEGGATTPAFTHPNPVPSCNDPNNPHCLTGKSKHLIPKPNHFKSAGNPGQIILTPSRIIAPVGSEVVALAGICGEDGHFVLNQPLEWMISNDSVGQIIEVGGMEHPNFNRYVPPSSQKFDGQYAWGRTGLKEKLLTRGTPSPCDDIEVLKGQTYISLSSASPGTTYLTAVAPKATGWDRRRATTIIHWVDGIWSIPTPIKTTSGTVQPLTTAVTRVADGTGIPGWKVRYTIIDGAPAEFVPTGSQQAELDTNTDGQATVQVRQQAGKVEPGTTAVRVDVIRPGMLGESELVVESGVTTITWSAPALTIVAKGPESAALDMAFNYRIEVSNPGDQVTRAVSVRSDSFGEGIQFISSNPKPAEYGKTLQWSLGDIAPGQPPRFIDVQMKGDTRGIKRLCFEVVSETDQLKTEACAETEIAAACLGLKIDGPTSGVVGQQATYNIEIFNQCNEALENVTINVAYEPGLSARELGNPITANIGRLEFGESRKLPLIFDLIAPGAQCFTMNISADGGHTAGARRCLEVSQAAVGTAKLSVDGTRLVGVNDRVFAKARIVNDGNMPLNGVTVINKFSPSLTAKFATDRYSKSWLGDDLVFVVGRIDPGQEAIIDVEYQASEADGNAYSQFTVTEPVQIEDRLPIRIEGQGGGTPGAMNPGAGGGISIPSDQTGQLVVAVRTLTPSIPADGQSRARVEFDVTNRSSTPIRNVKIVMLVPPGTEIIGFDSSRAELQVEGVSADGSQITLQTRQLLRANESLPFAADFVGVRPGQMTFEVQASSIDILGTQRGSSIINVTQ